MTSIFVFLAGAVLLIYSAEKLIGYLVGIASGLRVSVFLLAIIFTGIEFDDVFLGVALNLEDLEGVALGVVFGTALSMTGVVLALAAILTPTRVNIPREYVVVLGAAPLVMIAFTVMAPLTAVHGVILLALFVVFIAYVAAREYRSDTPVFRDAEMYEAYAAARATGGGTAVADTPDTPDEERPNAFSDAMPFVTTGARSGWIRLGLAVLALAGLIIGATVTGIGTEGILEAYGLEGTLFGATIATAVLTIEDIFLTVEPIRRGVPEIGVGNVVGSVVFSVTGKLGIILLAGGIVVEPAVLTWHLPALIVVTGLGAYFIFTGRLRRWHGVTLLALYIAYWVVSFGIFEGPPIEVD
ncbi:sodium:proton exchanger [Pseudonocardia sp. DSM 110487]|uniref:sodium:calcium antiporter n=1 Tax=Pseudonocardia sp. DSM 110487 TaxID=2865833 RepID=UPI001C6A3E9E|nr:sodium:proton exchanger [Pseudonocardia sp. DSM 110487]QYN32693.1 sodium:proton exchanger [Pseudonocardia sp. DSM 110487]